MDYANSVWWYIEGYGQSIGNTISGVLNSVENTANAADQFTSATAHLTSGLNHLCRAADETAEMIADYKVIPLTLALVGSAYFTYVGAKKAIEVYERFQQSLCLQTWQNRENAQISHQKEEQLDLQIKELKQIVTFCRQHSLSSSRYQRRFQKGFKQSKLVFPIKRSALAQLLPLSA